MPYNVYLHIKKLCELSILISNPKQNRKIYHQIQIKILVSNGQVGHYMSFFIPINDFKLPNAPHQTHEPPIPTPHFFGGHYIQTLWAFPSERRHFFGVKAKSERQTLLYLLPRSGHPLSWSNPMLSFSWKSRKRDSWSCNFCFFWECWSRGGWWAGGEWPTLFMRLWPMPCSSPSRFCLHSSFNMPCLTHGGPWLSSSSSYFFVYEFWFHLFLDEYWNCETVCFLRKWNKKQEILGSWDNY